MDLRKKKTIDRFVRSVSFNGPSLITLTKAEQGDSKESPMNFLNSTSTDEGNIAADYFRSKLQAVCPARVEGMDKPSDNHRDSLNSSFSHGSFEGSANKKGNEDFNKKIKQFIASKADLLFSMEGKHKLQKGVNYGRHPNQEVLDLYADTPPLETLMEVPLHVRRTQLFKCLKEGDIIIGKVSCKRSFGIIVTLTMLEYGCNRDFTDLDIQALCKSSELHSSPEYKDQTDAFIIGDVLRAVVIDVNVEENKILISLRHSRLPKAHEQLHLGIIEEPDTVLIRLQSNPEGLTYDEHLSKHKGFNNPRNIETLTELLGIDTSAPCSLLRCFQRNDCPEGDYAEPLRKQQSAKWSMETTAKGVEHFKAGNFDAAVKYFEHALQIDGENVEALVARGALCANQDKLTAAIKDFRDALAICPSHKNANKYLTATLVEYGIQQEKDGLLSEAVKSFNGALAMDRNERTAKDHLEKIQLQINQKKEKEKAAAKVEKGLKSRFSHVRDLILEEQSQAKRKRKRNDRKKKKKTMKSVKKKKKNKKAGSKVRRRSEHSSDSSLSSSESSSGDERSKRESSHSNDEWVEKGTTAPTETRKFVEEHPKVQEGREQMKSKLVTDGAHVKRRDYPGTKHKDCGEYEDRGPHPRKGSGESSLYDARGFSGISRSRAFDGVKGHEGNKCPSLSRSCEREKHGQSEGDWRDRKIGHGVVGEEDSGRRGKTREQESYKDAREDRMESSRATASNSSPSPANKLLLEKEIKRIRSRSDKGSVMQTSSAHCKGTEAVRDYSVQVCGEQPSFVVRLKDSERLSVVNKSREARLGQRMSPPESLNKSTKRTKARKSSLVSYEYSSDEGSS